MAKAKMASEVREEETTIAMRFPVSFKRRAKRIKGKHELKPSLTTLARNGLEKELDRYETELNLPPLKE